MRTFLSLTLSSLITLSPLMSTTVTFPSEQAFQEAVRPLDPKEFSSKIKVEYNDGLQKKKVQPIRNPGVGNVLCTELYKTDVLTVYYPEKPRVPNHLAIALNRSQVNGFAEVSEEENAALVETIKKVDEIYKTAGIKGFVIAQYDTPQEGHSGRFVVEVIPHLPGFAETKNIVDKVDCNRYVLYRSENLSPVVYKMSNEEVQNHIQFWKKELPLEHPSLEDHEVKIALPYTRKESHEKEAKAVLSQHMKEILEDQGGEVSTEELCDLQMPLQRSSDETLIEVKKCFFCDKEIVNKQTVYDYGTVQVFYNLRKGAKEGSNFLILPKRRVSKVYGLTPEEVRDTYTVRKALVEVIKDTHPDSQVVVYIQDHPSVGQTVLHTHEQVVAIYPKISPIAWTYECGLYPKTVSDEEIAKVKADFNQKMQKKMANTQPMRKAV